MKGRRIYLLVFGLILVVLLAAVYALWMPLDAMQYISLLFTTIAVLLLGLVPAFLPVHDKEGHQKVRLKLLLIDLLYLVLEAVLSYFFSFVYTLNGSKKFLGIPEDVSFYYLLNLIILAVFLVLMFAVTGNGKKVKSEKKEADDEAEDEPDPKPSTPASILPTDGPEAAGSQENHEN